MYDFDQALAASKTEGWQALAPFMGPRAMTRMIMAQGMTPQEASDWDREWDEICDQMDCDEYE